MRLLKTIIALGIVLLSGRFGQDGHAQTTSEVTITWNPSTSVNAAGYYLAWGTNSGDYFATNVYDGPVTNGMITGLDDGVLYYIAVAAFTSNGIASPFSNEIVFGTPAPVASNETVVVSAPIITGGVVNINWNAVPGQTYQVQYSTDLRQTNWMVLISAIIPSNSSATAIDALGPDSQRFYRIVECPQTW